ncbi:hypothetical protein RN001_008898 [Aquatica leii]|uniref:C2H2-type domain-containing protein n=1 Tax=Aquatica leii TaxID=1421715 RepID=A0AAN7PA74_9COLE|nr:hypothetical protein RN001_008898 [Aquatica leii]
MDVQPTQGCFVKLFGDNQANNIPGLQMHTPSDKHVNGQNPNLGYIINLEQPDSMSQIVQLNQGQGTTLDIYSSINQNMKPQKLDNTVLLKNVNNTNRKDEVVVLKPLGSCENPIEIIKDGELLHSTQNLSPEYLQQIAQALQLNVKSEEQKEMENAPPNIFYRVVYPDELNLKPIPIKPLKRGRKKKQPMNEEKDVKEIIVPPKLVKGFRTRSGRVTRPPQHIKNDFKKIDTSESDSLDMNGDLKTTDFESPNVHVVSEPVHITLPEDRLETHKRKRSISSQFRCPECKKAYLGNNKMLRHFEKHPEHRPKSDYYKARYDDTWNYLMDISNKNPVGQRGIKFCRELVNLLNNVKIVAKSFFKTPIDSDKNLFLVDSTLSDVLGIEPGNYALNESKLHKEVQVLLPCSTNGQDNNIKLIADTNFDICKSKDSFNENGDTYPSNNISEPSSTIDPLNFNHSTNGFNLNCDMSTKAFSFSESFGEKEKDLKPLERNKQPELSLHNELLSENSLLNSLPNLRNSVEELILNDNGQDTVMLDNSTSSDEVMNVDQFVNERLKNLTESDLALPNSLNLDLFQFHTS